MFQVAIIAKGKDSEQTASFGAVWSGFIVFAPMMKSSIIAADVKRRHHFWDRKNSGKLRVIYTFLVTKLPGCVAQSVWCLATAASLTANPGVASSIPTRSHTFVEIDHEIISMFILLPSAESFMKGCCQLQTNV